MKKKVFIILAALLLISLAGCSSKHDPNCGVYEAKTANLDGIPIDVKSVYQGGFSIELKEGEKAILHIDGNDYNLKWELNGDVVHIIAADTDFYGSLSNGVMKLVDFQDTGIDITLVCNELVNSDYTEYWAGRWYGWGVYNTGYGDYDGFEGMATDYVADIVVNGNEGTINIRYIEDTEETPTVSMNVRFEPGLTEYGRMVIENGAFMESELNEVEWVVDPGDSTVKDIDHMIEIVGTLYDSDNEENGFEYRIYLRPWGTLWDDVAATQSDDFIYADMMPVDYDDWYLPELGLAPRETADTDFDEEDMEELWDMEGFDEDFIFEELDPENIPAE